MNHRPVWLAGSMLIAALLAGGCERFNDRNGKAVSFARYDSVVIEEVTINGEAPQQEIRNLTEGFLQYNLLVNEKWRRGGDWDPEQFARYLEAFVTTAGTLNGETLKPAMTREKFAERYADQKEELAPYLGKARGTNPLRLRVHITRVDFPGNLEQIALGNKAEVRATVKAFGPMDAESLGTAQFKSIEGLPGLPLVPAAMITRAALNAIFDQYTRKHVMDLAQNLSREIVAELDRARKR